MSQVTGFIAVVNVNDMRENNVRNIGNAMFPFQSDDFREPRPSIIVNVLGA